MRGLQRVGFIRSSSQHQAGSSRCRAVPLTAPDLRTDARLHGLPIHYAGAVRCNASLQQQAKKATAVIAAAPALLAASPAMAIVSPRTFSSHWVGLLSYRI